MLHTALLLAVVAVSQSEIETRYDKFRDYTAYSRKLGEIQDGDDTVSLSVSALHEGERRKAISDSGEITLYVFRSSPRSRYLNNHDVIVMEGLNRFKTESRYSRDISKDGDRVYEDVNIDIRVGEAKEHLSGKDWEVKIGFEKPIPVGQVTRRKIKEFLDYIQAPSVDKEDQDKPKEEPLRKNGAVAVSPHDIKTNYDKFRDYTAYTKDLQYIVGKEDGETIKIYLFATHDGEERKRLLPGNEVTLMIYRRGKRWRYLKDHEVIMMEGRNRFKIEAEYSESLDDKHHAVNEHIQASMTIEEARKRLESGRDWEIKIGFEDPIRFAANTRKKIEVFLDYLQSDDKVSDKRTEPAKKTDE